LPFSLLSLAGCSSQTFKEIGKAPSMSPVGSGLAYGETPQMAAYPKQPPPALAAASRCGMTASSKLFQDARAISVGDILTVDLAINDKASFDNATDRSRQNASGINAGINIPVIGAVGAGDLDYGSNTSTKGQGTTERSESLQASYRSRRHRHPARTATW
jgi:flagellar L-ring protein precursor FlgH